MIIIEPPSMLSACHTHFSRSQSDHANKFIPDAQKAFIYTCNMSAPRCARDLAMGAMERRENEGDYGLHFNFPSIVV